ncbi:hypothetical protein PVK06_019993 [Gossypium arboreum]|uniref:RNase H type-1 domain-containing protein n=1 Tax=Gossypium arboreum TaxID=29729 RepID=A0ABR0PLK2_GOSAR|nr:hypothetical protein PVK06_019993 [Gossypium arboreum]
MELKKWQPTENPFVKINFDAAYRKHESKSCSVIAIRDSMGRELSFRVELNDNVPLVFAVEAIACLQLGLDLGFTTVEIEGDALSIVKKIHKGGVINKKFVLILEMGKGWVKDFKPVNLNMGTN